MKVLTTRPREDTCAQKANCVPESTKPYGESPKLSTLHNTASQRIIYLNVKKSKKTKPYHKPPDKPWGGTHPSCPTCASRNTAFLSQSASQMALSPRSRIPSQGPTVASLQTPEALCPCVSP